MFYIRRLPHIDNVIWLSKLAQPFPTTAQAVRDTAELWGFNKGTLDFLDQFPRNRKFASREDFFGQCDDLEVRMYEKLQRPAKERMLQRH